MSTSLISGLMRRRGAVVAVAFVAIVCLAAILAPFLTPYAQQGQGEPSVVDRLLPPSWAHPFGTDNLGRDVLARVLFGARSSLAMGFLIVGIAVVVGMPLGVMAGYRGGRLDQVIMRLTDVFLAFPPLLLAIALAAALGPSFVNTLMAIAITWWPWYARLARAQTVAVKDRPFVDAIRGLGVRDRDVLVRHVVPNMATPILTQATLDIGPAILTTAALSFIGLGIQPPAADWGQMVADGRIYLLGQPWLGVFPGLAIFGVAFALNVVGDTVRDIADPRMRGRP